MFCLVGVAAQTLSIFCPILQILSTFDRLTFPLFHFFSKSTTTIDDKFYSEIGTIDHSYQLYYKFFSSSYRAARMAQKPRNFVSPSEKMHFFTSKAGSNSFMIKTSATPIATIFFRPVANKKILKTISQHTGGLYHIVSVTFHCTVVCSHLVILA